MSRVVRIVLVDDDDIDMYVHRRIIDRSEAAEVVADFPIAAQALEWLEAHPDAFDLILLDINMPVMDGFGFLERFRRLSCWARNVVMLTSSMLESDRLRASDLHVPLVHKPLDPQTLHEALRLYTAQH